jgi:hypothetical protein
MRLEVVNREHEYVVDEVDEFELSVDALGELALNARNYPTAIELVP